MARLGLLLGLLLWPFTLLQAAPPQRIAIEYDMSYNGTAMAEAVDRLEHDGKAYTLTEEVRGRGIYAMVRSGVARRIARGGVTVDGLRSTEFRDRRGNAAESVARLDWDKRTITQGREGDIETQAMPGNAGMLTDRLSFLWTFAFGPADVLLPGQEVKAVLTDGKGLSRFRYRVAGREVLKTPVGELQTVKLVKQREHGDDRGTEIWFATAHHFLPVRILVIEKDGTRIDQLVRRIDA